MGNEQVIEFKKFPSLENTYQTKPIQLAEELDFDKIEYMVTEKVHGANFSFHVFRSGDSIEIKCAKRSGFIEQDEKFFNYRPVVEKYKEALIKLHTEVLDNDFILYGELYGGNIQSGIPYKEEQDFIAFDLCMKQDDIFVPLNKHNLYSKTFSNLGIPVVPLLGLFNSLQEALEFNEYFESKLTCPLFSGKDEHKEAEGIVIEPTTPKWFPNGSRVYFKKKTKRFLEKGGNKIPKPKEELPKELEGILLTSFEYITEPRFNAVASKIGDVSIKDIGKVMGLMTKDILEDMVKDDHVIPENKKFMKLLQQQVQTFIRPILLNK